MYKFLNINPLGLREEDCVCRAISLALEEDYYVIQHKLCLIADLFECDKLCVCCYKFLLDKVFNLTRVEEYKGYTIREFLMEHPNDTYIIRLNGHLTCAIAGICYDIWNCLDEEIDIVWCCN